MILILNCKVTQHRHLNYRQEENPNYPQNDRVDVLKYCLSGFETMKPILSKVLLFFEISPEFQHRKEELENYIKELFPPELLILNWYRNNYKNDWVNNVCSIVEKIDDDIIWHSGNDDHIFIDSSLDLLKEGIELLENDSDGMTQMTVSHIPEVMKVAVYLRGNIINNHNYIKFNWRNTDGIHIVKKHRFLRYWNEIALPNRLNFRPDSICDGGNPLCNDSLYSNVIVPNKELVRHFDGYNHIGRLNNIAPPLFIPPGFFEKKIKIKYGYHERDNNYTNLNPTAPYLYAYSNQGTDYRWCLEDIPLLWKDKIEVIERGPINEHDLRNARNKYFKEFMRTNISYCFTFNVNNCFAPHEWFTNQMI